RADPFGAGAGQGKPGRAVPGAFASAFWAAGAQRARRPILRPHRPAPPGQRRARDLPPARRLPGPAAAQRHRRGGGRAPPAGNRLVLGDGPPVAPDLPGGGDGEHRDGGAMSEGPTSGRPARAKGRVRGWRWLWRLGRALLAPVLVWLLVLVAVFDP